MWFEQLLLTQKVDSMIFCFTPTMNERKYSVRHAIIRVRQLLYQK